MSNRLQLARTIPCVDRIPLFTVGKSDAIGNLCNFSAASTPTRAMMSGAPGESRPRTRLQSPRQAFATCSSRTVRLWETATGKAVEPGLELDGSTRVAFTGDGKRLLVANLVPDGGRRSRFELRYVDVLTGQPAGEPISGPAVGATLPSAFAALSDLLWTPDGAVSRPLTPAAVGGQPFSGSGTRKPCNRSETRFPAGGRSTPSDGAAKPFWPSRGMKSRSGTSPPAGGSAACLPRTTPNILTDLGGSGVRELARTRPWFAAHPDGTRVLVRDSGAGGVRVRLWDLSTDPPAQTLALKHASPVYWVGVSPDGKTAATCSVRDDLRLWDDCGTSTPAAPASGFRSRRPGRRSVGSAGWRFPRTAGCWRPPTRSGFGSGS